MPLGFREHTLTEGAFQWLCMVPDFHSGSTALLRKKTPKKPPQQEIYGNAVDFASVWISLHQPQESLMLCVCRRNTGQGALTSLKRHINLSLPLGEGSPKDQSVDLALQPVRAGSVWCRTGCSVTEEGA